MLESLRVRNLALIEALELDFSGGFVSVTGETGAGKSILLGAMSILAGNRVEKSVIRQEADSCEVEARLFLRDADPMDAELEALGLPSCEEGMLILSRTISRTKGPRVAVNGSLTTLQNLRRIGERWIDFHGPGEPQKLFREAFQLDCLDHSARLNAERAQVAEKFQVWRLVCREIKELQEEGRLSEDEIRYLSREIEVIEGLDLGEDKLADYEGKFSRLGKAQEIGRLTSTVENLLEGGQGAVEALRGAYAQSRPLVEMEPASRSLMDRIEGLILEVQDLAAEYRDLRERLDLEPGEIERIEAWMRDWLSIKRRYGGSLPAVLERLKEMKAKLDFQQDVEGHLLKKEKLAEKLLEDLKQTADQLSAKRKKAAKVLEKEILDLLPRLGFQHARFSIEVVPETECRAHGNSSVRFLFSANRGEALQPLNAIASSGETARVMLALKTVLAEYDDTPVLVFDEVDANVGGEVAGEVARELARLGRKRQVFCVTHLPQVAAVAGQHFIVTKDQAGARATVSIEVLPGQGEEREAEIARMLGDRRSRSARSHARELLGAG